MVVSGVIFSEPLAAPPKLAGIERTDPRARDRDRAISAAASSSAKSK
jgi:hypothetical protein